MKKYIPLFFCLIFGFTYAQMINKAQVDIEIGKAKKFSANDPEKAIELCKNIYRASKELDYKEGMLESNTILMAKYFDRGSFKDVIEISKEAEKLAGETKNNELLSNVCRLRAASYTELGFNENSRKEFLKALGITEKLTSENYKYYQQALIYNGLASYSAHVNAPIDSVVYYQKKSLEIINKVDDHKDFINKKHHTLALAYINLGMTSNALHHTRDAEMYFSKALDLCRSEKYTIGKDLEVMVLNEFSWLYYDQKKYDKAISYAEQAERLEKQIRSPYIRRDVYEVFFKSYVEQGKKEDSKKYMNLYTQLNDSLINAEKKTINTPVKHLMAEQGEIHSNSIQKMLIITSGIAIVLLLTGSFFWKRNQAKLHKKYETMIESLKSKNEDPGPASSSPISAEKGISITDDTVKVILLKLEKFEKSQKFIKKDLSLTSLANELNTNTRYLSEIIKQYKGKNYNNYINGLRIDYITNKLYENPVYREYKISYLAEACGISSREVFAVIFKKETGVTPSYFINNLKKDYSNQEYV
ncbi:AraC family transcriptional regulator [Chryseobacterium populi]|uniref:DNA-binding domain-containing protein, AraC-type n=1 Tax=Chryseobacterium populi TaxID=1144316 RepID=J2K6H6_9FLAO|nr:AraC family transcriptional regulator [Chryseobacterium populi]EJL75820.1 DNA-binding domain-containing protein, AraC-type [Chryseobacterium populi]